MAVTKMGFEGKIYYGTAGSEGTTEITNSRDINYNIDTEKGDTTVRGSSGVPINTSRVTALGVTVEWTMLNKTDDSTLTALLTAAAAGNPVAIRTKSHSSGLGFDGDAILDVRQGKPIKGEQTYQFTATPNDDNRTPSLYS